MKTRLLTIVGIATASVFGTGFVLYSVTSYDFAPSTQENQYGVAARVLIQPTYVPSIVSSEDPPKLRDVLYFRYHSQSPASDLRITDIHKSAVGIPVSVDQQIMLVSDLQSNMDETLPFVYLVQIKNEQDKVESLSWITGNLTSSQTLTPGVTWIPFYEGWYTATAFVWEAIDNPTAHSPPVTLEFQVQK